MVKRLILGFSLVLTLTETLNLILIAALIQIVATLTFEREIGVDGSGNLPILLINERITTY